MMIRCMRELSFRSTALRESPDRSRFDFGFYRLFGRLGGHALRPLGPLGMLCPPLKRPRIVTKTTTSVPTSHSRSHTRTRLVVTLTIVVRVPYRVVTVVTHTYLPYLLVALTALPAGDVKEWPSKAPGPKKANLIRST